MAGRIGRIQSAQGPAACVAPHPEARHDPTLAALHPRVPNGASARCVHASAHARYGILGVLLMLAALLGLLAILSHAGLILGGVRDGIESAFGRAWFVPVIAAVALSAWLLCTKA